ncbi:MAG TPA: hypothetical protein VGK46_03155 [Saprospiraceae bacterium]|jgi:hypothetical protein
MPYVSPIPLLSEAQRTQFPDIDLKKIRNEILLHFQFSAEPVVEIHGHYYDKDEVVTLLDMLQANPGLHWTIYQHTTIRELLEEEDLQKFNQAKAISAIDQHPEHAESIHDLLVEMINNKLPEHILDFSWETTNLLGPIQYYTSRRTAEQQAIAYSNTFTTLRTFTESLKEKYPDPFVTQGKYAFKPELSQILQSEVIRFFKYLPAEFKTCLVELGVWCYNHVVVVFVKEQHNIKSWPKESIQLVIEAATIAAQTYNKEGNDQLVNQLENYLVARPSSNPWRIVLYVIMGIIFLIRIGNSCSRQQNRSSQNRFDRSNEIKISNDRVRDVLEAQGFQFDESGNVTKVNNQGLQHMRRLNGSDPIPSHLITYKDKVWNKKDSILTIRYETEVLPKGTDGLKSMLTEDLIADVAGKKAYIDLKFLRKGIKGVALTHRFVHEADGKMKIIRGRITDQASSGAIKILPLKDLKRYKGMVTMMDLEGDILDRDTLSLRLKPNTTFKSIVYNGFVDGSLSTKDSTKLHIRGVRSTCLLGVMGAIENVVLKNHMEEKRKGIATYGFMNDTPVTPDALNHSTLARTRSSDRVLIYTYTSVADHTAYLELDGDEFNIRYMIDTKSGEMVGCQMALISEDRQYVERLEMFLTK